MSRDTDQAMYAAKRPQSVLAGPYGHPFHPVAVTIPIGAWVASLVFDIVGLMSEDAAPYAQGARVLIIIGLVGAVIAGVIGSLDLSKIEARTRARKTGLVHLVVNLIVMALFTVGLFMRVAAGDEIPTSAIVISAIALAALGFSGWLGGKLSFEWGVRVADEATQREGFEPSSR